MLLLNGGVRDILLLVCIAKACNALLKKRKQYYVGSNLLSSTGSKRQSHSFEQKVCS